MIVLLFFAHASQLHAEVSTDYVSKELNVATISIVKGRVQEGLDRLAALQHQIDPKIDSDSYWRVTSAEIEFRHEVWNYVQVAQLINFVISSQV
jgi:hypothetical protein